jgi:hypothetical protein
MKTIKATKLNISNKKYDQNNVLIHEALHVGYEFFNGLILTIEYKSLHKGKKEISHKGYHFYINRDCRRLNYAKVRKEFIIQEENAECPIEWVEKVIAFETKINEPELVRKGLELLP